MLRFAQSGEALVLVVMEIFDLNEPMKRFFKNDFDEVMAVDGKEYRAKEGRRTVSFFCEGEEYFAKVHRGIGWGEIWKNLSQLKKPVVDASNEWLAADLLHEIGVDTITVVGRGLRDGNPATRDSFVLMEALAERGTVEELLKKERDVRLRRMVTRKVATSAGRMHRVGMNHRDFYLCHFHAPDRDWSQWGGEDDFVLPVMDLHRAQLRKRVPRRWLVKDLGALFYSALDCGISRGEVFLFLKTYLGENWKEEFRADRKFWDAVIVRGRKFYRKHCGSDPVLPWRVS